MARDGTLRYPREHHGPHRPRARDRQSGPAGGDGAGGSAHRLGGALLGGAGGHPRAPRIEPLAEQQFRLANGAKIIRKKGGAVFKRGDRIGVADVIFGEEADSPLLGATTLEALGLSLDPIRRELEPLPLILAAV